MDERGAERPGSDADPEGHGPETALTRARHRALDLAAIQATDDEIGAALRAEFYAVRPVQLTRGQITRFLRDLSKGGILEDARTAGRLLPLDALRLAATKGDVTAATALHKRQELLDGLDPALLREIKRWMAMEPGSAVQEAEKFLAVLRAAS